MTITIRTRTAPSWDQYIKSERSTGMAVAVIRVKAEEKTSRACLRRDVKVNRGSQETLQRPEDLKKDIGSLPYLDRGNSAQRWGYLISSPNTDDVF